MAQSQPLRTAAGNAQGLHRVLERGDDGRHRPDNAVHNDVLDAIVIQRLVLDVSGEAHRTVPQVLRDDAADKYVLHDNWFDECYSHFLAPAPGHSLAARKGRAGNAVTAIAYLEEITASCEHRSQTITYCNLSVKTSRPAFISRHSQISGAVQ